MSRTMLFPASLLIAGLAGCASVPADWGRGDVAQAARDRGRELPQIADATAFTRDALTRPLTPDVAVQLALLNNPEVRIQAARLGIAAGEVYAAGRLANPLFSGAYLEPRDGGAADLRLGIAFNFVSLLFLPANSRYASAQFEAAKLEVASATVNLAAKTEETYFDAVGADQLAQMRSLVAKAARASADLAQRFFDAGNITRRELAMEQAAASQAHLDALSAQAQAVETRSELNRAMGLSASQDIWPLDARLAEPLAKEDALATLQQLAVDSRLDLAAARKNAQALASRFGFDRRTRLVNNIQVGVERESDDGEVHIGPTLELELPLFNWGTGRVAAARARLDQAEAELDAVVLDASNEVKLAHAKIASARARAEAYRSALIPQREQAVEEAQKEQNYMLIGIFEVILAKQQTYDAYAGYIESVRDYWTARTELTRAVGRKLPGSVQAATPTLDPAELTRPKGGGMQGMEGMNHGKGMKGMEGMDMKDKPGMEGMDMKGKSGMEGMDHGEGMKGKDGMDRKGKPGMEGMDMKDKPDKEGMNMKGMPGMESGPDCSAMKNMDLSKLDPTVAKAMQEQCDGAGKSGAAVPGTSKPMPKSGHDMGDMPMEGMDHGAPKKFESPPEAPHAH